MSRPGDKIDAMPFYALASDTAARVVLEQTGATTFTIVEPFRYVDAVSLEEYVVPDPRWGEQEETDLASVPGILLWFVPRYGNHTLPALLHDQLVDFDLVENREKADRIFRDAMGEQGVHLLRRWLMWAAVSIATMTVGRRWLLAPIIVWLGAFGLLAFRLTPPFAAWHVPPFEWLVDIPWWSAAIAAALGPAVLAVLWGRRLVVGIMSGYGAFLFAVPIVAILLALGVYWVLELAAGRVFRRAGPRHPGPRARTVEIRQSAPPAES